MEEYQRNHRDQGLEDLGNRRPERVAAVDVRDWLKRNQPQRWEALTKDVFMKLGHLKKDYDEAEE